MNMMSLYIPGFLVFFVCFIVSRFLNEKGMKELGPNEKSKLIDGFSDIRKYSLFPIIVIVALYFLVNRFFPEYNMYAMVVYFVLLVVFLVVTSILTNKKMKELGLPEEYVKKFFISRLVQYAGIVILIGSVIADVVLR